MATNISITRSKTGLYNLAVTDADGSVVDLTGMTLYFHASASGIATIEKSSPSSGITITNAAGGLVQLKIDPADTADVPDGDFGIPYEFTLLNGTDPYEIVNGSLHIGQNVSTP